MEEGNKDIFGSMPENRKEPKEGFPDFSDVKKLVESNFSPDQIREVATMLKDLGYPLVENITAYDLTLQQALINLQKKYGAMYPSLLDIAVQSDNKTPLIINDHVQQGAYGILGNGIYNFLKEITGTRKNTENLKSEVVMEAIEINKKLAELTPEEQKIVFDKLGISPTTGFGSATFVDVVRSFQQHYDIFPSGKLQKDDTTWQYLLGKIPYEVGFQGTKFTQEQAQRKIDTFEKYDFFSPIRNQYSIDLDSDTTGFEGTTRLFGEADCSFPPEAQQIFSDLYNYKGEPPIRTWFFEGPMLGFFFPESNGIYINSNLMLDRIMSPRLYEMLLNEGSHYLCNKLPESVKKLMLKKSLKIGGENIPLPSEFIQIDELLSDLTSSLLSYDAYLYYLDRNTNTDREGEKSPENEDVWSTKQYLFSSQVIQRIRSLELKKFGRETLPIDDKNRMIRFKYLKKIFQEIHKGFMGSELTIDV